MDSEKGIVYGCRLAEVGELAVFKDLHGDRQEIMMTPKLIGSLLDACLAEERLSAHWTHGWIMGGADGLLSSVATWRNFRKDDSGNLVADAFTWPGVHRDTILHAAENDPEGMMVSMVFDYTGDKDNAVATRVSAADFVETGAATTALCTAVLSAFAKIAKLDMPNNLNDQTNAGGGGDNSQAAAAPFTPEQVSAIQQMIQAALNPPDVDTSAPPAMFAAINKLIGHRVTAGATEAATLAEARFVKSIGGTAVLKNFADLKIGKTSENDFESAVTAALSANLATVKDRASAVRFVAANKPALYNAHMSGK